MKIDLNELEALARAATPGPWELNRHGAVVGGPVQQYVNGAGKNQLAIATGADWMRTDEMACNAKFIAAANPVAVLDLIALARQSAGADMAAIPQRDVVRDQVRAAYDDGYNHGRIERKTGGSLKRYDGLRVEGERTAKVYAALAGAQPVPQHAPVAARYAIDLIVRDIAELDYSSDIDPELMRVTVDDLRLIIERHATLVPAASMQPVPEVMRKCNRFNHHCNCLTDCPATGEVGGPAQGSVQLANGRDAVLMAAASALAWKWHRDAVKDGFACSEPAQELFEVLGWPAAPAHPANVGQVEELSDAKLIDWLESQDHFHALRWSNTDGNWFGIYDRDRNVRGTGLTMRTAILAAAKKGGA